MLLISYSKRVKTVICYLTIKFLSFNFLNLLYASAAQKSTFLLIKILTVKL